MSEFDAQSEIDRFERLARKALVLFGLDEVEIEGRIGSSNVLFEILPAGGDAEGAHYALRVGSRDASSDQVMRELLWLTRLCQHEAGAVPEPILSRSGRLVESVSVQGVSGFRLVVLLRWVEGRPLDAGQVSLDTIADIGRFLARIHERGRAYRWPEELERPIDPLPVAADLAHRLRQFRERADDLDVLVDRAIDLARRSRGALDAAATGSTIVHGDFRIANLRVQDASIRAIGFDRCRRGYGVEDLASIDLGLRRRDDVDEARAALLEGYGSESGVSDRADEHIAAHAALATLDELRRLAVRDAHLLPKTLDWVERLAALLRTLLDEPE